MSDRELERRVTWALDEFDRRIRALEDQRPAWRPNLREAVEQRRHVVARLRESGLSITQIATAIGAAVATVQRDLDAVPHRPPAYVLGTDGRRHPTVKGNGRPEA